MAYAECPTSLASAAKALPISVYILGIESVCGCFGLDRFARAYKCILSGRKDIMFTTRLYIAGVMLLAMAVVGMPSFWLPADCRCAALGCCERLGLGHNPQHGGCCQTAPQRVPTGPASCCQSSTCSCNVQQSKPLPWPNRPAQADLPRCEPVASDQSHEQSEQCLPQRCERVYVGSIYPGRSLQCLDCVWRN